MVKASYIRKGDGRDFGYDKFIIILESGKELSVSASNFINFGLHMPYLYHSDN